MKKAPPIVSIESAGLVEMNCRTVTIIMTRMELYAKMKSLLQEYNIHNKTDKGEYKMKSYSSHEAIQALISDGWYEVSCAGIHHQFKRPTKQGRVTIKHPHKDIPIKTLSSISKQSGIQFK